MKLLVKIAVMMMATAAFRRHRKRRGEGGAFVFFFLELLPRWEKGFPSDPWTPWRGRGRKPLRDWICLSVSLCFCVLVCCPFTVSYIYMEIRNSDWTEIFAMIFSQKLAFLWPKKGINRLTGCPRGSRARLPPWGAPLPHGPLGHRLALILLPKNHKYSKIILHSFLSRLDSV